MSQQNNRAGENRITVVDCEARTLSFVVGGVDDQQAQSGVPEAHPGAKPARPAPATSTSIVSLRSSG
jgi:hypothetical protein